MRFSCRRRIFRPLSALLGFAALWALLGVPPLLRAQVKLYLKDGSYQLVESYEVRGDRVRCYSLERSGWEEIPKSLVDFEATRKAQQEQKAAKEKDLEEARELEKERFEKPEETGFEVAPGVRLP